MDLQTLGVFSSLDSLTGPQTVAFAQQVEQLGYSTLWIVEGGGRDALTHADFLLAKTERLLSVGSGDCQHLGAGSFADGSRGQDCSGAL